MKKKQGLVLLVSIALAFALLPCEAFAITTVEQGNALVAYTTLDGIPLVENESGYQAQKYKIGKSPNFGTGKYETKKNTIKASKYKGMNYTFKTSMFLPAKVKKKGTYTVQNMLVLGKYVYVLYVNASNNNKGFLARYNYAKVKSMGLDKGKKLKYFRQAFNKKFQGKELSAYEKKVVKLVKVGPLFTVGHGQTLAYNSSSGELWMAMDLRYKNGKVIPNNYTTLERINLSTMKPNKAIRFYMKNKDSYYQTPFSLAFDSQGNGYFLRNHGNEYYGLYRMTMNADKVTVEYVQRFKYGPSVVRHVQSMSYNPYRDTLNFICNGAIMAMPVSKIGNLSASDFSYELFKTNREFETIQFDSNGYAYLLCSKGPEVLKSTAR